MKIQEIQLYRDCSTVHGLFRSIGGIKTGRFKTLIFSIYLAAFSLLVGRLERATRKTSRKPQYRRCTGNSPFGNILELLNSNSLCLGDFSLLEVYYT